MLLQITLFYSFLWLSSIVLIGQGDHYTAMFAL